MATFRHFGNEMFMTVDEVLTGTEGNKMTENTETVAVTEGVGEAGDIVGEGEAEDTETAAVTEGAGEAAVTEGAEDAGEIEEAGEIEDDGENEDEEAKSTYEKNSRDLLFDPKL